MHCENFETNYSECLLLSLSFAISYYIYLNLDSFELTVVLFWIWVLFISFNVISKKYLVPIRYFRQKNYFQVTKTFHGHWLEQAYRVKMQGIRMSKLAHPCTLCTIFTILLTLWNSKQKNGLLIKLFCFHQNRMKNKKVLLIARFCVQDFKVSVESWKSSIVQHYENWSKPDCWHLHWEWKIWS